jgi:hypothetical protein
MRCKGHVVFTGDIRNAHRISIGKLNRKIKLGHLHVGVSITLKWILMK